MFPHSFFGVGAKGSNIIPLRGPLTFVGAKGSNIIPLRGPLTFVGAKGLEPLTFSV
jgi:hypothetical protein